MTSPQHTREPGVCRFPYVPPKRWKCQACNLDLRRGDRRHTMIPVECRHAMTTPRMAREGAKPRGRHPRSARVPASEEPTAEMTFEEEELALEEAVAKEQLGLEETAATDDPTAAAATEIVDTNPQESQLGSILTGEIDHTCYWDSIDRPGQCQREELMNGVCDDQGIMSVGREECRGQDCFDCNYHCK